MKLAEKLSALEASPIATWVFDLDRFRIRWANAKALEFWRADGREDLFSRDYSDMSLSTVTRIRSYMAGFGDGRVAEEDWTIYPRGVPTLARLYFAGIELDDGRLAALIQGIIKVDRDPDLMRNVEALRHTSVAVTLLDPSGAILLRNPAALRLFGGSAPFADRFLDRAVVDALFRAVAAGEVFRTETLVRTAEGDRWHAIEAMTLPDPATGAPAILVHQADETSRRGAEMEVEEKSRLVTHLHETLAVVERQREQILALSAPILEVGPATLTLPIIGALDAERAAEIEGRLLSAIAARAATSVILDLTGAAVDDVSSVDHLARMARAMRLLGVQPIVTGIAPKLAMMLTSASADLPGVLLFRSLKDGIAASRRGREAGGSSGGPAAR